MVKHSLAFPGSDRLHSIISIQTGRNLETRDGTGRASRSTPTRPLGGFRDLLHTDGVLNDSISFTPLSLAPDELIARGAEVLKVWATERGTGM